MDMVVEVVAMTALGRAMVVVVVMVAAVVMAATGWGYDGGANSGGVRTRDLVQQSWNSGSCPTELKLGVTRANY